tara:strand:- start:4533 stop:4988 length:456 start_codon:yes stop_codon:yes gene_type:complete
MNSSQVKSFLKKKSVFFVLPITLFLLFFARTVDVNAALQGSLNNSEGIVIEHIKLNVPRKFKDIWLSAEKNTWEPWLEQQNGFLGRQLLWDKSREEATLLISWSSREVWKKIPQEEIQIVQQRFEKFSIDRTGSNKGNPFPLVFEGELLPQ